MPIALFLQHLDDTQQYGVKGGHFCSFMGMRTEATLGRDSLDAEAHSLDVSCKGATQRLGGDGLLMEV